LRKHKIRNKKSALEKKALFFALMV